MPLRRALPSDEREVGWEPLDVKVVFRATRAFSLAVDELAAELRLTRSLLLREAVRRGLPALVNDVRLLRAEGFKSPAHLAGSLAVSGRRGSVGEGVVTARWLNVPGPVGEEPEIPVPVAEDD